MRRTASMVVVVCGLMSVLAPPALAALTDLQAQAQTLEDIRSVSNALSNWLVDQAGQMPPGPSQDDSPGLDLSFYQVRSQDELEILLVPQYIAAVPEFDGWGWHYEYFLNYHDLLGRHVMAIRSVGRNGVSQGGGYTIGSFDPAQVDRDIVWGDGELVQWPALPLSDRQAQARTVDDIRNVGTAMFSWLTDQVARSSQEGTTIDLFHYSAISHSALESLLVPQYIAAVPELDGWGWHYEYYLDTADPLGEQIMAIRSPGRDGADEGDLYTVESFDPDHFDEDIVWADGFFVRWPEELEGLSFYTVSPCRAFDTRLTSALQSGVGRKFHFGGLCGIPMSAKGVAVNVTVVAPTGTGHVSLFPGTILAPTNTIAFAAGQTRSNNAILGLGGVIGTLGAVAGGAQVHLILDVNGYFE